MVTNKVRERTGQNTLESREWFGHVYRVDSDRIARQAMDWIAPDFKRKRGRARVSWISDFNSKQGKWQSPTWGRPAAQVRVDSQFRYSKFLSQQRHVANDPENRTLEPHGK